MRYYIFTCFLGINVFSYAQSDDQVSSFLDEFLTQIEEGGVSVDQDYLDEHADMPADMKAALRDSLQGRESFVLVKDNASSFLSNFSSTIEKYGFESGDNTIKLKNNRLLNFEAKGTGALAALFGGVDPRIDPADTVPKVFPVNDINSDLYNPSKASNIDLDNPDNNKQEIEYNPLSNKYLFSNKVGDEELNVPVEMSADEYYNYSKKNSLDKYWESKTFAEEEEGKGSLLNLGLDFSGSSQLFGKGGVSIKPQGYADLTFSVKTTKIDNPTITEDRRKTTYFDLDNKIQMNVLGSVGDKINLDMNYNTEATFDFDNQFKLEYNGKEDDIVKHFKAGNVSMPSVGSMITLGGSSSGGQSSMALPGYQKLFGFQNTQQYGKLTWAWVVSQQKSETQTMTIEGGAMSQEFDVTIDDYDANRHFFLTHFFKEKYDNWMSYMPNVDASGLNINKIEVWVTNKRGNFDQSRNLVAFMDLAEPKESNLDNADLWWDASHASEKPSNGVNKLYDQMNNTYSKIRSISNVSTVFESLEDKGFIQGEDYEKVENARLLSSSEYTLNTTLGYISLSSSLNTDEVLAVAFQYTYRGEVYQVGEFSSGSGVTAPDVLFLKLLKATNTSPSLPTWDLMMKNIYALDAYNMSQEDFSLSIVYEDDDIGTDQSYISAGDINKKTLLQVMGLDQLNSSNETGSDGFFDWVEGYTVNSTSRAQIIFPVREPFGSYLKDEIGSNSVADKYIFQELYDTTLVAAQQMAEKNKFRLTGTYKSTSGSEIKLNAYNIPRGSVKVTAGGRQLTENVDYSVDYNSGYLRILNEGILESGQTIQVSMENQSLYSLQKKTMLGTNLVYRFSDDLQIGASVTHLNERPQTTKVAVGDDPISNTVWGLTGGWRTDLPFLTKVIDKLPFTDTKAPSSMTVRGEVAQLIAGHNDAIGETGSVYLDDFESTKIGVSVQSSYAWDLSSVPRQFEESALTDSLDYGYNRAKLAWYSIDRIMQVERSETPDNIDEAERNNHYVRTVNARNLFPKADYDVGESTYIPILNLAYYPSEKGPYNYDTDLDANGRLSEPEKRWAGITRKVETTNFENSNIEYIEFWMMDPYIYSQDEGMGGEIYFNLGNISEDVLKDGRKAFENGLPSTDVVEDVDYTKWGRVSTKQSIVNAFDNNESARTYQDVGIDGLGNDDEKSFFATYIAQLEALKTPLNTNYIDSLINDPSQDDYHYYRGSDYDEADYGVLARYKNYNNYEGNSPSSLSSSAGYSTAGTSLPDGEDINQDYTLSESDSYYGYKFSISPSDTVVGSNYIVDTRYESVPVKGKPTEKVKWYQYRIPIHEFDPTLTVGAINDFTSIRFMRMYMTGFKKPVVLRLANLELVRSEWRRYGLEIEPDIYNGLEGELDVEAVNYEENSDRENVNYILPPSVSRATDPAQQQLTQLNEQSMVMRVRNLSGRDSRAAYKVMQMDFRQYEKLQMWVHAEKLPLNSDYTPIEDGDLALFVRLGSDYNDNYYEYELPLSLTPFSNTSYNSDDETDRYMVWPEDNRLDVPLELFTDLKVQRNSNDISNIESFTQIVEDKPTQKVSIKGNPSLSNVRMVMIGVRNTKSKTSDSRSAEIWVNELRLSGLEEGGGWTGNGSMVLKLADIGTASAAGSFSTTGWGSIEETLAERSISDNRSLDVSTSLELGKLLPRKAKIQMPMYYAYSKNTSTPKYDPLNQDLLFSDVLNAASSQAAKDSISSANQNFETRKSLNFSNVKLNIQSKNKRFYDPVNLSLSYSFSEVESSDETTEREIERERKFAVNYNFSPTSKPVEPFKNMDIFKSDYLALIRDFNFYLKPQKIAFSSVLDRNYYEQQSRDFTSSVIIENTLPLLVKKDLDWNNAFSFSYKLAKSLSVDYSAQSYAVVNEVNTDMYGTILEDDELESVVGLNQKLYGDAYDVWWRNVRDSVLDFGTVMDYSQKFNVRYNVPISKIPLLDFINVDAAYTSNYTWNRGNEGYWMYNNDEETDSTWVDNGNLISNTQQGTLNTSFKMTKLYNKSKYLSEVSNKYGRIGSSSRKKYKTVRYEDKNVNAKKGEVLTIKHKLGSSKANIRVFDANGKVVYGRKDSPDDNTILFVPNVDIEGGRVDVSARIEDAASLAQKVLGYTANALMGVRTVSVNMIRGGSTSLPGFTRDNSLFKTGAEPGWDFALGMQDRNIFTNEMSDSTFVHQYYKKGWLVTDTTFAEPYMVTQSDQVAVRATIEPLPGLSIKLSSSYNHTERMSAYYIDGEGHFDPTTNMTNSGNYSHTWVGLGTFFEKQDDEFYTSEAYDNFVSYREDVADLRREELNVGLSDSEIEEREDVVYDPNSPEILIPAFIAAYSKKKPGDVGTSVTPSLRSMLPNWQMSYSGLAKTKLLKPYFKNITLSHNYVCTYNVSNYMTLTDYEKGAYVHLNGEDFFTSEYDISSVIISEGMNPLIGVDMTLKNNLSLNFSMNKLRSLALNIASNQVIESRNNEIVFGAGYRFEDFKLLVRTSKDKKGRKVNNDLRLNVDFSIRDMISIIRRIQEVNVQPSSGNKITALKLTANYNVNSNLEVTVFYDRQITNPVVSTSFRTMNSNFGMTFRFSLTQ